MTKLVLLPTLHVDASVTAIAGIVVDMRAFVHRDWPLCS
jgi:hypothetical protein